MNRLVAGAAAFAALTAATALAAPDEAKMYASARCDPGLDLKIANKSTLHCNFKPGSAELSDDPGCVTQLEPVLRALQEFKSAKIMVLGFADARGKADVNKALSIQRASAVRKYLIDGGVAADRFSVDGFGSDAEFLLCTDKTEDCNKQNRRIEVASYLCKKPAQLPAVKK